MLAHPRCAFAVLAVICLAMAAPVFGGAYVPFDPKLWVLPTNFKIQRYYSGASLGLATEYGNLPKSRSLAVSGLSKLNGPVITYVSTKGAASQSIYAMVDRFGRGQADYAFKIISFSHLLANASAGTPNAIAWVGGETGSANGTLYILVSNYWVNNQLYKVQNIDSYALTQTAVPTSSLILVRDDFPSDSWHGWRYIRFDKNKNLFIGLGANCNACDVYGTGVDNGSMYSKAYDGNMSNVHNFYQKCPTCAKFQFASIYKLTPPYTATAAPGFTQYASGVRNTVGFDFHPSSGALYFTDNGRDDIGGTNTTDPAVVAKTRNTPDCEFNVAATAGANYGFPFCHTGPTSDGSNPDPAEIRPHLRLPGVGTDHIDPDLNSGQSRKTCDGTTYKKALQAMGPHTAPLGMRFYKKDAANSGKTNFPLSYDGTAFIAQRGSWDRDTAIGARVMNVKLSGTTVSSTVANYTYFLAGGVPCDYGSPNGPSCNTPGSSQRNLQTWVGRPVDVEQLPDSTLLVSDDEMGAVYRIVYCSPTAAAAWGGNAPYGVGRCGRSVHPTTPDKNTANPITATPAGAPSLASGCQVNLGPAGIKAFKRCNLYDLSGLSGRGAHTYIAWNLKTGGPNGTLILDAAIVNKDYVEVNGNGWFGWGFSPTNGGATMPGTNVYMSSVSSDGANAGVATYKMGTGAVGMPGFKTTTDFLVPNTPITAVMAGEALVTSFQAMVPKSLTAAGGNLTSIAAFGDRNATDGSNLKHWAIDIITIPIASADKDVAGSASAPVVNPASPSEPSYTPSCPSTALPAGDCGAIPSVGCLNGETFNSMATLSSYPGVTMSIYSTLSAGTLTLGISANVASFNGANGYAVFCNSTGNMMGNNNCMFLRKYSTGAPEAVNYILDGYNGYQPTLPAKCAYSNNQALATSTVTNLVGRFTMPFSGPLKVRFGGGAAPGGTGIDGMVKHPAGSPPYFACMFDNGNNGVDITPMPAGTTYDLGWTGTACGGAVPAGRKLLSFK